MQPLTASKVITFNRTTRDFDATFDGQYIGSFGSYSAAENALNDHAMRLIEDGLIDLPLTLLDAPVAGDPDEQPGTDPWPPDSAVRTHLTFGHLRRDLFAPTYFCACGARATIVRYGNPDVCLCDRCHTKGA